MIRRTKAILELPSREDKIIKLSFDEQEEKHYRQIERPVTEMFDGTSEEDSGSRGSWLSIIQQINKLRLVCNLGTFVPSCQPTIRSRGSDPTLAMFAARFSVGGEVCEQCLQVIESSTSESEVDGLMSCTAYVSACYRLFCASCANLLRYQTPESCSCTDQPTSCPLRPTLPLASTPGLTPSDDPSSPLSGTDDGDQTSSKVREVISRIMRYSGEKQ